jgi:hypothetical protein
MGSQYAKALARSHRVTVLAPPHDRIRYCASQEILRGSLLPNLHKVRG